MSRIAKAPITVPSGVEVKIDGQHVSIKGPKGALAMDAHRDAVVSIEDGTISVRPADHVDGGWAMAGTMSALVSNMVVGVSLGFQKKLELVGVGYRAQAKGKVLSLTLGFSHPVDYSVPEGISIETPSQTDVVVSGCDKQKVGQVAAEIRSFRPPEPYKGKGVRYEGERIIRKEAKKK